MNSLNNILNFTQLLIAETSSVTFDDLKLRLVNHIDEEYLIQPHSVYAVIRGADLSDEELGDLQKTAEQGYKSMLEIGEQKEADAYLTLTKLIKNHRCGTVASTLTHEDIPGQVTLATAAA